MVVLDIMMPGEDGLSLCRHLRANTQLPVIMLTAMAEDTDRVIGLEMGADDYLAKPFNPRELVARIRPCYGAPIACRASAFRSRPAECVSIAGHSTRRSAS